MIVEAFENFLCFGTAFALAGFVIAGIVRAMARWRGDLMRPRAQSRLYSLALIVPPLASAWFVTAALLPRWWFGEHEFDALHPGSGHSFHLVGTLTDRLEPALAYAVVLLVAGMALLLAWSMVCGHRRLAWAVDRLQLTSVQPPAAHLVIVGEAARQHGLDVGLVQSDYPLSFVWGLRRSKLVLSSGLLSTLTPTELAGMLEHEAAHHARRDNLVKLGLALCAHASLAAPLSRRLLRWRNEPVELLCDEIAAARTSAPLEIAEALVKLRRRTQFANARSALAMPASPFVPEDDRSVERRVRRLLALADAPLPSASASVPRCAAPALALAAICLVSLAVLGTWAPFAIHAATESILLALR
jgi:hypothetical protein